MNSKSNGKLYWIRCDKNKILEYGICEIVLSFMNLYGAFIRTNPIIGKETDFGFINDHYFKLDKDFVILNEGSSMMYCTTNEKIFLDFINKTTLSEE